MRTAVFMAPLSEVAPPIMGPCSRWIKTVQRPCCTALQAQRTGGDPQAGLIFDAVGNLYGTTQRGGTLGWGVVFKLDPSGKETVLHSFRNLPDGAFPDGDLILDGAGNLYGTTWGGGSKNRYCGSYN